MSKESNIERLVAVATLPLSLNPALWNIGILLHKQATRTKHFESQCITQYISTILLAKCMSIQFIKKMHTLWEFMYHKVENSSTFCLLAPTQVLQIGMIHSCQDSENLLLKSVEGKYQFLWFIITNYIYGIDLPLCPRPYKKRTLSIAFLQYS